MVWRTTLFLDPFSNDQNHNCRDDSSSIDLQLSRVDEASVLVDPPCSMIRRKRYSERMRLVVQQNFYTNRWLIDDWLMFDWLIYWHNENIQFNGRSLLFFHSSILNVQTCDFVWTSKFLVYRWSQNVDSSHGRERTCMVVGLDPSSIFVLLFMRKYSRCVTRISLSK